MVYDNQTYLKAQCEFVLTEEQFEEYVFLSDFMSKKKRISITLVFCFLVILALAFVSVAIKMPALVLVMVYLLFGAIIVVSLISLILKKPPFRFLRYQEEYICTIYKNALGISPIASVISCSFILTRDSMIFQTGDYEIISSPLAIQWVACKHDLVVVGCIDGSKSLSGTYIFGDGNHYKAVPAMVFLKSKLEGMDPDELIAILEEYAKKPKRPLPRKDAWK